MEFIKGEKLSTFIEKEPSFISQKIILGWALELCDVLHYLHSRKPKSIIYRSLAPQNLIISSNGVLKLIDFGLSKIFDARSTTLAVAKSAKMYFSPM
jgi:serine/threonine-protein kinase